MKILVSACLLGRKCRYDGGSFDPARISEHLTGHQLIPVCPEQLGGMATPRTPSERDGERVFARDGEDVTAAFYAGARMALALAQQEGCRCALLKERSPSCGSSLIYDGSFTGRKIPGEGVASELLRRHGIAIFSEEQLDELLAWIAAQK